MKVIHVESIVKPALAVQFTDVKDIEAIINWGDGKIEFDKDSRIYPLFIDMGKIQLYIRAGNWIVAPLDGSSHMVMSDHVFNFKYQIAEDER